MSKPMLEIKNLCAGVEGKQILKGLNLTINAGRGPRRHGAERQRQKHAGRVLAGRDGYDVTGGEVLYCGQDLLEMDPEERAREGFFSPSNTRWKFPA